LGFPKWIYFDVSRKKMFLPAFISPTAQGLHHPSRYYRNHVGGIIHEDQHQVNLPFPLVTTAPVRPVQARNNPAPLSRRRMGEDSFILPGVAPGRPNPAIRKQVSPAQAQDDIRVSVGAAQNSSA
jgi:hypothetical protein